MPVGACEQTNMKSRAGVVSASVQHIYVLSARLSCARAPDGAS